MPHVIGDRSYQFSSFFFLLINWLFSRFLAILSFTQSIHLVFDCLLFLYGSVNLCTQNFFKELMSNRHYSVYQNFPFDMSNQRPPGYSYWCPDKIERIISYCSPSISCVVCEYFARITIYVRVYCLDCVGSIFWMSFYIKFLFWVKLMIVNSLYQINYSFF